MKTIVGGGRTYGSTVPRQHHVHVPTLAHAQQQSHVHLSPIRLGNQDFGRFCSLSLPSTVTPSATQPAVCEMLLRDTRGDAIVFLEIDRVIVALTCSLACTETRA